MNNKKPDDGFQSWIDEVSRMQGRKLEETPDYDLRAYYNKLKNNNPEEGTHFDDDFKNPNHMTFSTSSNKNVPVIQQGGEWLKDSSIPGGWKYKPSELNIKNAGTASDLQGYFNRIESPEALDLPNHQKVTNEVLPPMSMNTNARIAALRKLSGR